MDVLYSYTTASEQETLQQIIGYDENPIPNMINWILSNVETLKDVEKKLKTIKENFEKLPNSPESIEVQDQINDLLNDIYLVI